MKSGLWPMKAGLVNPECECDLRNDDAGCFLARAGVCVCCYTGIGFVQNTGHNSRIQHPGTCPCPCMYLVLSVTQPEVRVLRPRDGRETRGSGCEGRLLRCIRWLAGSPNTNTPNSRRISEIAQRASRIVRTPPGTVRRAERPERGEADTKWYQ